MKGIIWIIATCFFVSNVACNYIVKRQQDQPTRSWYKGNLHTHSYWSDGDEFPEMIMDWYKSNGYHFVALSDHNILAQGEKWIAIKNEATYQNAFGDYLREYGEDWVVHRMDSGMIKVRLKELSEYRKLFEKPGDFLILQSEEISDDFEGKPIHLNATNLQILIDPQGGQSVSEVIQRNIDAVNRQRKETGVPMIPHVNHPNFHYAIDLEDMLVLDGERFFEVYNGHPQVHNQGDSLHMATEEMWDLINISYLGQGKPLMYGLATDDAHHYHVKGSKWSNAGRGWVMVYADSLTAKSIILAMEEGQFYASTGVELDRLEIDSQRISITVAAETGINYHIAFIGCRDGASDPEVFKEVEGEQATFDFTKDILFIRCKITSTKRHENPIENLIYEMAWTQPVLGR